MTEGRQRLLEWARADNVQDLGARVAAIEVIAELVRAERALRKINAIRNSIVGYQNVNWSAHIYPLVAALDEAGVVGMGARKAMALAKTTAGMPYEKMLAAFEAAVGTDVKE